MRDNHNEKRRPKSNSKIWYGILSWNFLKYHRLETTPSSDIISSNTVETTAKFKGEWETINKNHMVWIKIS